MPTVVVIDVSLSMTRPVSIEGSEEYQRKHLAAHGLTMLFEHMATNYKLEFTALVVFSSLWELMVPFTRDYNTLQVVLVTDGSLGIGRGSLRHSLSTLSQRSESNRFPLPFPFPSKLYVMCMANLEELQSSDSLDCLERLIDLNNGEGQIFTIDGPLCLKNVQSMFGKLIDVAYTPFHAVLKCGHLSSDVQAFPRPEPFIIDEEIDPIPKTINTDIASPPVLSRHLVLPIALNKEGDEVGPGIAEDVEDENSANQIAGKIPNFCVLLHGSLKVEGMVAVPKNKRSYAQNVTVWIKPNGLQIIGLFAFHGRAGWSFGQTQVLLVLLNCGAQVLKAEAIKPEPISCFSNGAKQGRVISLAPLWARRPNTALGFFSTLPQTDVQKILRNARKLPEKTLTFYKELNRLRKAALAFGFLDLLKGVADILERECTLLPDTAHPDAAFQLTHAAQQLKMASSGSSEYATYDHNITPLQTDFSGSGTERM
ncbi:hypothetical protein Chor_001462 [Crotalus horridus]